MANSSLNGYVFQTKTGEWRGKLALIDPATQKKIGTKVFYRGKSEADIRRKMREYAGNPINYTGTTVGGANAYEYFRKWADNYKKRRLKPTSYDRLDAVLRLYIEPEFSVYKLSEITADNCDKLLTDLRDRGLSYSTVKKVYDAMNDCFGYAVDKHELLFSPMQALSMLPKRTFTTKKKDGEQARHLTQDEWKSFQAEIDRKTAATGRQVYRYRDAFILDVNTGMRIGELIGLDWSDVDFKNRTVSITKNAAMVKERDANGSPVGKVKQIIQDTPKTSKSNRIVPLNQTAIGALERLKEQAHGSAFVFPTQTGARLVMNSLEKQYGIIANHCGIEGTSFHSLRHTFATRLFEKGVDVKKVSELLGHASVAITYNTYIHVIQESKADAVELLDDVAEDAT